MNFTLIKTTTFSGFLFCSVAVPVVAEYEAYVNWETITTDAFNIELLNPLSTLAGTTTQRSFTDREKTIIRRVANTLENTFANRPVQKIQVRLYVGPDTDAYGASGNPLILTTEQSSSLQKTAEGFSPTHGETNLSTVEYIWKYGQSYGGSKASESDYREIGTPGTPSYSTNTGDIRILFSGSFFKMVGYTERYFEATLMHEIGHAFGFFTTTGTTAIQEHVDYDTTHGYNVGYYNGDKAVEVVGGNGVRFAENTSSGQPDFAHIDNSGGEVDLMFPNLVANPPIYFSDAELAVLTDMGWSITEEAWRQFAPIPEPSFFGIFAGTLALMLVGMRRKYRHTVQA